jgi:hypothetical protein
MSKSDTPRTDEAWAAWGYAGSGMSVHVGRELERELTAVTEQRDGLRSGIDYASDQLHKVTEQRDRLAAVLQRIRDGYGGQVASPNCCEDCDYLLPIDEALQSLTAKEV